MERTVLCGASAYEEKYYFNRQFDSLPENVKEELQIMCVLFTEDVGGVLTLEYDENGSLEFKVMAADDDFDYDSAVPAGETGASGIAGTVLQSIFPVGESEGEEIA